MATETEIIDEENPLNQDQIDTIARLQRQIAGWAIDKNRAQIEKTVRTFEYFRTGHLRELERAQTASEITKDVGFDASARILTAEMEVDNQIIGPVRPP